MQTVNVEGLYVFYTPLYNQALKVLFCSINSNNCDVILKVNNFTVLSSIIITHLTVFKLIMLQLHALLSVADKSHLYSVFPTYAFEEVSIVY